MAQNKAGTFWLLDLPADCVTLSRVKERAISAAWTLRRLLFSGGTPLNATTGFARANKLWGGLMAVGSDDPGSVSLDAMSRCDVLHKINASEADLPIDALSAEKGHFRIEPNQHALTIPIVSHLVAVMNSLAGTIRRSPSGFQRPSTLNAAPILRRNAQYIFRK